MSSGTAHRFWRLPGARLGVALLALLFFIAIFSPILANSRPVVLRDATGIHFPALSSYPVIGAWFRVPSGGSGRVLWRSPVRFSPGDISLPERLQSPSPRHWLGTDDLGRDVLARLIYATPVSLSIGLIASGISLVIGLLLGGMAGYAGGVTDLLISRLIELFLCFPSIFLILALIALLPSSIWTLMVAIGITSWPEQARYARAEILKARELDYTRAAQAAGASPAQILRIHLIPAALPPVLISAAFGVANAILYAAALSFLGVGVPPPTPSWGGVLALAQFYISQAWWLALFPGIAIFVTVAAYNLVGEAWQMAVDPASLPERPGGLARLWPGGENA